MFLVVCRLALDKRLSPATAHFMALLEALIAVLPEDGVAAYLDALSTSLAKIDAQSDNVACTPLHFPPGDRGR